jgi:hypothetical protein
VGRVWPRHGYRGRPLNSVVSCHRMRLRKHLLFLILVALSSAGEAAPEWPVGVWRYIDSNVSLTVRLNGDSSCFVGAVMTRAGEGRFFPCSYSVAGETIIITWTNRVNDAEPRPARLFYNAVADSFVFEEEPRGVLMRMGTRKQR